MVCDIAIEIIKSLNSKGWLWKYDLHNHHGYRWRCSIAFQGLILNNLLSILPPDEKSIYLWGGSTDKTEKCHVTSLRAVWTSKLFWLSLLDNHTSLKKLNWLFCNAHREIDYAVSKSEQRRALGVKLALSPLCYHWKNKKKTVTTPNGSIAEIASGNFISRSTSWLVGMYCQPLITTVLCRHV